MNDPMACGVVSPPDANAADRCLSSFQSLALMTEPAPLTAPAITTPADSVL